MRKYTYIIYINLLKISSLNLNAMLIFKKVFKTFFSCSILINKIINVELEILNRRVLNTFTNKEFGPYSSLTMDFSKSSILLQFINSEESHLLESIIYKKLTNQNVELESIAILNFSKNLIAVDSSNYYTLKLIYRLLLSCGFFLLSYEIRLILSDFLHEYKGKHLIDELNLLLLEEANNLTSIRYKSRILNIKNTKNDDHFRDYLYGKKIIILGPVNKRIRISLVKDSIIIFPKYTYNNFKSAHSNINIKVSYYQISNKDQYSISDFDGLDFIVSDNKIRLRKNSTPSNIQFRLIRFKSPKFYSGYSTHIPKILFDLISFKINLSDFEIKIHNVSLFYGNDIYFKGYRANPNTSPSDYRGLKLLKLWQLHGHHDLITNLKIMKSIYRNGHFEADKKLTQVLSMSTRDYLAFFEKNYSSERLNND